MRLFKFAIKVILVISLAEYAINSLGFIGMLLVIATAYHWFKNRGFMI